MLKISSLKKPWLVHPFLSAVYPIAFLYSHNIEEVPAIQTATPVAISLLVTGLLMFLLWALLKDGAKAAIAATTLTVLFFSYGHVAEMLGDGVSGLPAPDGFLVFLWPVLLAAAFLLVVRTRRDLSGLTAFLNVMGLVMLAMTFVTIATFRVETRDLPDEINRLSQGEPRATAKARFAGPLPDIYYIILDSYPSDSTLKAVFAYDNSPFTDYLTGKGFYVGKESRSNYALTYLSLASSLNMEYINYLSEKKTTKKRYSAIPYQMVKNNRAAQFLRRRGYKFIHFRSGWSGTARNKYADLEIQTGGDTEFAMMLAKTSMLRLAEKHLGWIEEERQRRLTTFKRLADIPLLRGPKFSFVHLVFPHPPYLFDAVGKPVTGGKYNWGGPGWAQRETYKNQLIFANKLTKQAVDQIIARSKTPPIIVIQGDHGPASSFYVDGDGTWKDPTDRQLSERTGILNAYYFQGKKIKAMPKNISPVNSFRLIFNTYFDGNHELLENKVFFSNYSDPYGFTDVTERFKR